MIRLRESVVVKYMPLLSAIPLIMSEVAGAHLVHVFAGGELFSILIQIIAGILRRRVVVTFHGYRTLALYFEGKAVSWLKRKLLDTFYYLSVRWSHAITFVSNLLKSTFRAAGIPMNKIITRIVHNGTDMKPWYRIRLNKEITILSVIGGHPYRKGLDILLNVLRKLELQNFGEWRIKLVIVGRIPRNLIQLINLVQENGISVLTMHEVPRKRLLEYYGQAHISIQLSRYDSFLLPALEAASQGCAVIVSNRAGLAEVLKGSAIVVNIKDIECIANVLQKLLVDDKLREEVGRKCYSASRMYTYDKVALRYLKCYLDVLRGQKAR